MNFTDSLKHNYEFRRLYAKGECARSPLMVIYCRRNRVQKNRLGITVSTKIGKAVIRNRVRRRLREIYRLNEEKLRPGSDIVLVARTRSRYAAYGALEREFIRLAEKLKILSDAG